MLRYLHGFKDKFSNFLIEVLSNPKCQNFQGSCHILLIFRYNFNKLSRRQKTKLLEFIEANFERFRDCQSLFYFSEILGENYRNEEAFELLRRLRKTKIIQARIYIPHGFEHVIKESGNIRLSLKSLSQLYEMKKDRSKHVRYEAELSIARVRNYFSSVTESENKTTAELISEFRTSWNYTAEYEQAKNDWNERKIYFYSHFSTVEWLTPCCKFPIKFNFKFSSYFQPQVSWLRSSWNDYDARLLVNCGKCGLSRRPDWMTLLKFALRERLPLPPCDDGRRVKILRGIINKKG